MTVELLWWDGCPSHPEALDALERILREEGVEAQVRRIEIESDEQARRERFPGSPTIRIDGEDVVPSEQAEPYSLTCRVYRTRDGRVSPLPDPEDLREAVRRAV
jgi:predicted methyltransferase